MEIQKQYYLMKVLPHLALPLAACSVVMPRAQDDTKMERVNSTANAKKTALIIKGV